MKEEKPRSYASRKQEFIYIRHKLRIGIAAHKKRIPTLSADSGIVLDNSRIVKWRCIVLWSDNGVCAN